MSLKSYHEESLRPPATEDAAAAATTTKWDWAEVLLDHVAYMVDKKNHTSAPLRFKRNLDGKEVDVQVTFCFAKPPRVSHFCCHAYFTDDHGEEDTCLFFREPFVFATDGNLALITLCIGLGRPSPFDTKKCKYEYLVYQAASSPEGKPGLTRIPKFPAHMLPTTGSDCIPSRAIGLVRYRSNISTHAHPHKAPFTPPAPILSPAVALARPQSFPFTPPTSILSPSVTAYSDALAKGDACDAYRIAALAYDYFHDSSNSPYGPYYICTYDSKAEDWIRKPAAIPQPPLPSDYICDIDMVITIGGSSRGIMGWVDLWNGMLLSDVLADHKPCRPLRYVTLPKPTQPQNWLPLAVDIGCNCRDIVLVKETGIIRFVDLQVHADPSIPCSQTPCGWTVLTWTLEGFHEGLDLETLGDLHFQPELELHSSDISGYKLPQSLFVSNPILSSNTDGVLYLRTNASSATNRNSQVIAVDIKHKMLLDVKEFDMQRPNNYMRTSISSYLKPPVSNKSMKRRAPQ
ncbi:uncharacterized protein LOC125544547 [Triticum urartu]|uniref:uncharacterized protein LOC125544547 n=1 Tax=Triticum urartu TaxID=4572 RepID=UPI0020438A8C|nr:uncharacterized protein LOC125544547 [Triticum urartu]